MNAVKLPVALPPVALTPGTLTRKASTRKAVDNPWVAYLPTMDLDDGGKSLVMQFDSDKPARDVRLLQAAGKACGLGVSVQNDETTVTFQLRPRRNVN